MVPTLDFELNLIVNLLDFASQHGGPREPYNAFSDTASDKERHLKSDADCRVFPRQGEGLQIRQCMV